ncbi:hypothetical protein B296_00054673 [Ensete ventricosum]|uniref:Protein kinase domain-containing protein n=1 Tax=Ensete ventricosum TaxID=4639 RepID=A0A426XYB7_ENSVE|nr:hypothetical protein B296_00054673 [Ensete ventricosum]
MPPPPGRPHRSHNNTRNPSQGSGGKSSPPDHARSKKSLTAGLLIGIVIGSAFGALCIILAIILCLHNIQKCKNGNVNNRNDSGTSAAVGTNKAVFLAFYMILSVTKKEMQEQRLKSSSITNLKPPTDTVMVEKLHGKNTAVKPPKVPITATSYTVASLQIATNSFSQDCLVGEGSFGRVYRAEFPNGKVIFNHLH